MGKPAKSRCPHRSLRRLAMPRLMFSDKLCSKLEKVLLQQSIYQKPDLCMTDESYALSDVCWLSLERPAQRLRGLELVLQKLQRVIVGRQVAQGFSSRC